MLSYVHGVSDVPLSAKTVGQCLDAAAERAPDGEALVVCHQQVRWTYSELRRRADVLAASLLNLGLEPGERVGLWAPNCAEWVLAQFATAKAGLVLVNLNPAYRLAELEQALLSVDCAALIIAPRFKTSDYVAMLSELLPRLSDATGGHCISERFRSLRFVISLGAETVSGMLQFRELAEPASPAGSERLASVSAKLQFDDAINIQFTSGTTGAPKAATLTHHNIVNNAYFSGARMALGSSDRLCIPVPMYHCFGMVLGTLCCVVHHATMVLPAEGFDAGATLSAITDERCTAVHGVPTMFIAELDHPDFRPEHMTTLRTGIMAGAPCPEALMRRVIRDMHVPEITIAYGMTETGPVSFQTAVDDPVERRVATVGRVLPHVEIKIVDTDGRVVPRGTQGELMTRGYLVMRGYWNDPERTAQAVDEARWIASGDLAVLDEEGYCCIVGRTKDMLIRGGENIFPREIEEFLYGHPKVEQVEVFGVPDPKYGEEVCAWIKLKAGETAAQEEIREFCAGRIAHFKIPRYVRFVDEFPMTVTGKVQKYVMRERMVAELEGDGGGKR